jgi:hypothetical protein
VITIDEEPLIHGIQTAAARLIAYCQSRMSSKNEMCVLHTHVQSKPNHIYRQRRASITPHKSFVYRIIKQDMSEVKCATLLLRRSPGTTVLLGSGSSEWRSGCCTTAGDTCSKRHKGGACVLA